MEIVDIFSTPVDIPLRRARASLPCTVWRRAIPHFTKSPVHGRKKYNSDPTFKACAREPSAHRVEAGQPPFEQIPGTWKKKNIIRIRRDEFTDGTIKIPQPTRSDKDKTKLPHDLFYLPACRQQLESAR